MKNLDQARIGKVSKLMGKMLTMIAVLATLGFIPFFAGTYLIVFLFLLFTNITLAESFDIVTGYAGYVNLGHVAFFGIGAYTFATFSQRIPWLHPSIGFLLGGIVASIIAAGVSYPFFRVRGAYFAMVTLGFGWLMFYLATNLDWLTGGAQGISISEPTRLTLVPSYYLAVVLALTTIFTSYVIAKSKFGLGLLAVKADEQAAQIFGVNAYRLKTLALAIAAFIAGLMGGVYMYEVNYINPTTVFGMEILLTPPTMALLGGTGIFVGPVIGAIVLMVAQEILWVQMPYFHLFTYGLILILVGMFMRGGIVRIKHLRKLLRVT